MDVTGVVFWQYKIFIQAVKSWPDDFIVVENSVNLDAPTLKNQFLVNIFVILTSLSELLIQCSCNSTWISIVSQCVRELMLEGFVSFILWGKKTR